MARFFTFAICCFLAATLAAAAGTVKKPDSPPAKKTPPKIPDLAVDNISLHQNGFVHITLKNKSPFKIPIKPANKEKIFLVIYIDNLKRAEYKLKYMNPMLFSPNGSTRFRTNFRVPKGLKMKMKAEINLAKIIKEPNYRNNRLEKILHVKPRPKTRIKPKK